MAGPPDLEPLSLSLRHPSLVKGFEALFTVWDLNMTIKLFTWRKAEACHDTRVTLLRFDWTCPLQDSWNGVWFFWSGRRDHPFHSPLPANFSFLRDSATSAPGSRPVGRSGRRLQRFASASGTHSWNPGIPKKRPAMGRRRREKKRSAE